MVLGAMTLEQVMWATAAWIMLTSVVYSHSTWRVIRACYSIWLQRSYWTNYNIIDGLSWLTKAAIIVPGLIFGIQLWWLYLIALVTSMTLIWASQKKMLPTMVAFNTLWIWLSCMVLAQHLV